MSFVISPPQLSFKDKMKQQVIVILSSSAITESQKHKKSKNLLVIKHEIKLSLVNNLDRRKTFIPT